MSSILELTVVCSILGLTSLFRAQATAASNTSKQQRQQSASKHNSSNNNNTTTTTLTLTTTTTSAASWLNGMAEEEVDGQRTRFAGDNNVLTSVLLDFACEPGFIKYGEESRVADSTVVATKIIQQKKCVAEVYGKCKTFSFKRKQVEQSLANVIASKTKYGSSLLSKRRIGLPPWATGS